MRASRLLSLLLILQTRGRTSASALSEALGVSIRTVYRDIEQLEASGVPIVVERGARGGFELVAGWRTRLTGLTAAEAKALFLCGLPGPAQQLGMGDAVASAQLKLLAALPAEWHTAARRVWSRFHLDPIGWYRGATPTPLLDTVSDAVWNARRLRIRYESWKATDTRTVDPLGLVMKAGEWYLVGRTARSPRTYRVSNVLAATMTGETSDPPADFDLGAYWEESVRRFERELFSSSATVRASRRGCKLLREWSRAVAEAVDRGGEPGADGWRQITIPIESLDQTASELLRMGTDVEVLEPAALRERVGRKAAAVMSFYGSV